MKKLSHWAAAHPVLSRWMIALMHVALFFIARLIGAALYIFSVPVPFALILIFSALFSMAFIFYPEKGAEDSWFKNTYLRQKSHDFALIFSAVLVLGMASQSKLVRLEAVQLTSARAQLINYTYGIEGLNNTVQVDKPSKGVRYKQFKQKLRKDLKELKKSWKQTETNQRTWIKVVLFLLLLLVVVGLGLLVAALSCSLSCNGMDGLAVIVLVVGWGGLIALGIWLGKKILQKDWSKPDSVPNS